MKVNGTSISGDVISKTAGKNELNKDAFLKILTAELQHQDPLNAGNNEAYITQMAQFSSLEQMQNLNSSITQLGNMLTSYFTGQRLLESSMMIGKMAKIQIGSEEFIEGEVKSVKSDAGSIVVIVNDKEYSVDDIIEVYAKPQEEIIYDKPLKDNTDETKILEVDAKPIEISNAPLEV